MNFTELKPGNSVENAEISSFKSERKSSKYIYLISGVHGDEVEGVYVLKNLFEWLKNTDDVDLPLIVIPLLNVDGYRANSRLNAHGVDLNRNLPTQDWTQEVSNPKYNPGPTPLSEPENKYLVKLFEKFPPYFSISFHSWKPLLNYNGPCMKIAEFLSQYNNYPLAPDIGYPTPGSLGTYLPEKYNAPVLTFECPHIDANKSLKDVWEENKEGLIQLFTCNLLDPKNPQLTA